MVLMHSEIGREVMRHFKRVVKPRARLNPIIPPVERIKNMTILDMLSTEVGVPYVSKVVVSGDNIEWNCWMKRRRRR